MKTAISNTDDVIDSRDVIERIEELEGEIEALTDTFEELVDDCIDGATDASTLSQVCNHYRNNPKDDLARDILSDYLEENPGSALAAARVAVVEWNDDNADELRTLKALASQAEGYAADWRHGESLIRESYFEDHIRELVDDCYTMPEGFYAGQWPWRHMTMDWKAAADEARQDYSEVEFGDVTYLIR